MKKLLSALMSLSLLAGVAAMPAAAAETYSLGDADMNGVVDSRDSVVVLCDYLHMLVMNPTEAELDAFFAEGLLLNEEQRSYADVDGSGSVDSLDAAWVLEYYVYRLITETPVSSDLFFADPYSYMNQSRQDEDYMDVGKQAVQEGNDYARDEFTELT